MFCSEISNVFLREREIEQEKHFSKREWEKIFIITFSSRNKYSSFSHHIIIKKLDIIIFNTIIRLIFLSRTFFILFKD